MVRTPHNRGTPVAAVTRSVAPLPSPFPLPSLSPALQAVLWMVLSTAIFATGNILIRHATSEVHPFQVAFFRNAFSLLCLLPLVAGTGLTLRTNRLGLYLSRSATSLCAMLTWFYGLSVVPLADATALAFTLPLFATIGAALFLGETVRLRRWIAVVVGFVGVLIILRPGAGSLTMGRESCWRAACSPRPPRSRCAHWRGRRAPWRW